MREGGERRESQSDLELGRSHMLEIVEKILPLVNHDESANEQYHQMIHDIKKTTSALDLKNIYRNLRRRLSEMDIGGTGGTKPEDQKLAKKLLIELNSLPIDLFQE